MNPLKSMIFNNRPVAMPKERAQKLADECADSKQLVRFSVVVPAYREADIIEDTIQEIRSSLHDTIIGNCEIVVVDDGSDDDTGDAASRSCADVVIHCRQNKGRGAALRRGLMVASGEVVAYLDADLSYAPDQLTKLLAQIEAGADVVVGDRRHPSSTVVGSVPFKRRIATRMMPVARTFLRLGNHDTQCGFKGFSRAAADQLAASTVMDRWAWDVEALWLAERLGMTVEDMPVVLQNRSATSVRFLRDGMEMLKDMLRIRIRAFRGLYPTA